MICRAFTATIFLLVCTPLLLAAKETDVRGISLQKQENKVVDEKCLGCHNREKIDAAVKQRKSLENVMKLTEHKGVTLTDADREVLGHFWQQNPLKKKK